METLCFFREAPFLIPSQAWYLTTTKHLGVLAYSMEALKFFSETEKGPLEKIEDVNELRFLEHGKEAENDSRRSAYAVRGYPERSGIRSVGHFGKAEKR